MRTIYDSKEIVQSKYQKVNWYFNGMMKIHLVI